MLEVFWKGRKFQRECKGLVQDIRLGEGVEMEEGTQNSSL